jgi:phospholipid/cholesterol/gamma-HCH transport system permease protein
MAESFFQVSWERAPSGTRAVLRGALSHFTATAARQALLPGFAKDGGTAAVDLSSVDYLDGAGTAVLLELDRTLRASGRRLEVLGAGVPGTGILSLIDWEALVRSPDHRRRARPGTLEQLGGVAIHLLAETRQLVAFVGSLAISLVRDLAHRRMRWAEVFRLVETSGVDAAPIVALISTLLGLIMAFLGALQLRKYGANIYVADGVALAMVRELGPIMTAVLVAGRSGSGFAAELGSMAVDDQVDALVTMGFDPVSHLAVPRVVAVVLALPCLAMLSSLSGIAGGLAVGVVQLDLTASQYLAETRHILTVRHLMIGLVKAAFFGLLVSAVGCYRGLGVRGGAEQVGRAATAAVVAGILLIVLADALFAVVLAYLPF